MHYKLLSVLFVAASAAGTAIPAASCNAPEAACQQMDSLPQCGDKWITAAQGCVASGCRQFIVNPLDGCPKKVKARQDVLCTAAEHACSHMDNLTECSDEWVLAAKACVATNCRIFVVDPLSTCPGLQARADCSAPDQACQLLDTLPECSDKWLKAADGCVASGCRKFVVNPKSTCTAARRRDVCSAPGQACKKINTFDKCGVAWTANMEECLASGCTKFLRNPLDDCIVNALPIETRQEDACAVPNQACQKINSFDKCGVAWTSNMEECLASGCIKFLRDPLEDCIVKALPIETRQDDVCSAAEQACKKINNFDKCGVAWTANMEECVASGCIKFIRDPLEDCVVNALPIDD